MTIKKKLSEHLLEWYEKNKRDYLWRKKKDPYKILIAEIMLQRTKADQVLPVYLSFMKEFPVIQKLNEAGEDEIRKYFSRLGLLWRAQLVKDLAKELMNRFKGKVPENRTELLSLPGVGEYIADAVLSFAYRRDVAVVDSNVCRIIGRVFDIKAKGEARRDPKFRKIAQEMLPAGKARKFNLALLDFAALVCIPKNPKCHICPINDLCAYNSWSLKSRKSD